MKFLCIGKPARTELSLEHLLAISKANKEWLDKRLKDGTYDCVYNFPDGGGMAIANVASSEAVYDLLTDYPARVLFDWEIIPLVDNKHAIDKTISRIERAIERQKQRVKNSK